MVEYSIIVPIRNEEYFVKNFLLNIEKQTLAKSKFEVILLDGMSTDCTKIEVDRIKDQLTFKLVIVDNPKKIIPSALNIGYRMAKGHIIIRLDVHSNIKETYLEHLTTMFKLHSDCCNLGGRTIATGYNATSRQIAFALNTPFGVGGAKFRYAQEVTEVDSVFPGIFHKKDLDSIEGWNESWLINEDAELNFRLKKYTNKKIKVIPDEEMQIEYYPRSTLKDFAKQYFRYGLWRNKTNVKHPYSMRISHLVPPVFLVTIIISFLMVFVQFHLIALPLAFLLTYFLLIKRGIGKEIPQELSLYQLLIVFLVLHFSWGTGTIIGYVIFGVPFKGIVKSLSTYLKKVYTFDLKKLKSD
ncbi:glycosyltransferase family 2 protein [Sporosarcina sp.]|uniref:glycosyltransferase family 2 protein n=1 Tax=Sporosarcina sp. TaxID=49982 RepID=UPI00261CC2C5|nr:glycosyltransferase family 2 protein [Sporosarcina sp.]